MSQLCDIACKVGKTKASGVSIFPIIPMFLVPMILLNKATSSGPLKNDAPI